MFSADVHMERVSFFGAGVNGGDRPATAQSSVRHSVALCLERLMHTRPEKQKMPGGISLARHVETDY